MFTFEFHFYPKSFEEHYIDDYDNSIQSFIACLYKNGQILAEWSVVKFFDHYTCRVVAPEMDSLDEKFHNKYCKEDVSAILEKSLKDFEIHFIGENYDVWDSCGCFSSSHYVLFTDYKKQETYPVVCGDCRNTVPLYKLPKTYAEDYEEYYDVQWWQRIYNACDTQFMSGTGERHGYKMMNDPNSALSKEGLRICAFWEERVKKPFYYYLFKYYKKNKPTCPKCNENWVNHNEKIKYDYVCEKCRLVSNDMK